MQNFPPFIYRSFLALSPALLLSGGCATSGSNATETAQVIAHRGASAYAPENTLAAFRLAHEMGAQWFELDTMLSSDGEMVVIHDNDLERTTNGVGMVWESDWPLLRGLDAGTWFSPQFTGEPIPHLSDALKMAKGKIGVYVEIKSSDDDDALHDQMLKLSSGIETLTPELAQSLFNEIVNSGTRNLEATRKSIAIIREHKMEKDVVIQSFSQVVCFIALQEAPEIRTEFLGSDDEDNPKRWEHFINFGKLINVAGFNVHHESLTPERLEDFKKVGKSVAVWTVDDPAIMRRLSDWGVDFIITNKPDLYFETLAK